MTVDGTTIRVELDDPTDKVRVIRTLDERASRTSSPRRSPWRRWSSATRAPTPGREATRRRRPRQTGARARAASRSGGQRGLLDERTVERRLDGCPQRLPERPPVAAAVGRGRDLRRLRRAAVLHRRDGRRPRGDTDPVRCGVSHDAAVTRTGKERTAAVRRLSSSRSDTRVLLRGPDKGHRHRPSPHS